MERLRELALLTEELNPAFTVLNERIIPTRTQIGTERERVSLLTLKVDDTRSEVQALGKAITDLDNQLTLLRNGHAVQLGHMRDDVDLSARQPYDNEQSNYTALQIQALGLRNSVRTLEAQRAVYRELVDAYRTDVEALATHISSVELRIAQFDRQIQTSLSTFLGLAARLQEARIAEAERAGYIRVVASAVEPQVPIGSDRRQNILLLSVPLGLVLGVGLAMFVDYLQGPQAPRREEQPPQAGAPVS